MSSPRFELWCDRCGRPIRANFFGLVLPAVFRVPPGGGTTWLSSSAKFA